MKIRLFSGFRDTCETEANEWLKKHKNKITIQNIEFSSSCSARDNVYHSVMIVYIDKSKVSEVKL